MFTPSSVDASPGDMIEFQFDSSGHTVTRGGFGNPCQPLDALSFNSGFVDSGVRPVSSDHKHLEADVYEQESFVISINNTDPIYYYCAAQGHCQAGMAAAINAP